MARARAAVKVKANQSGNLIVAGGRFRCVQGDDGVWVVKDTTVASKAAQAWVAKKASELRMALDAHKVPYSWKWELKHI